MEKFGDYLKAQREKKGIRLEEIASITKIHLQTLLLLETGQWRKLPPEPFIRGFIIAYAKYVGADPKVAIQKYLEEVHGASAPAPASESPAGEAPPIDTASAPLERPPHEMVEHVNHFSPRRIATAGGITVAAALAITLIYYGKNNLPAESGAPQETVAQAPSQEPALQREPTSPAATQTPAESVTTPPPPVAEVPKADPPKAEAAKVEAPKTEVASATVKEVPPAPGEFAHEVVIEGQHRTWTKIVIDGDAPFEFFLPEGQKATYRAKEKIKVVLGNSAGSKVVHNGTESPGVKFNGTIRSYIFPENARFPQDIPVRKTAEELQEREESKPQSEGE